MGDLVRKAIIYYYISVDENYIDASRSKKQFSQLVKFNTSIGGLRLGFQITKPEAPALNVKLKAYVVTKGRSLHNKLGDFQHCPILEI